jgi:hypothetical protein
MSETVRMVCGDIFIIVFTAVFCLVLVGCAVIGIICAIKWLRGDFKENGKS